jgi:hypothetical protein
VTRDRVAALSEQLIHVHQALRERLESHFSYEERRIATALDILGPQAWTADVFTPGQVQPGEHPYVVCLAAGLPAG